MEDNGTLMQYFHWYYGNNENDADLWDRVSNEVSRLSQIGITALWLPPAFKTSVFNPNGNNAHEIYSVGYDIYDLYDLGEFNQKGTVRTKYGTKDQYLAAIKKAHENHIDIYADVVFNHKAGADETEWVKATKVAANNRNFTIDEGLWIEAWTKFTFNGRGNKYSDFKWNYKHFDGVDWANNLEPDKANGIFKFNGLGKDWDKMLSDENGNYDYLMYSDIDMNHPEVRTELAHWAKWFLEYTRVDGFRLDAIKHIQYSFFRDWIKFLQKYYPHLFFVGEYWSPDINILKYYIEKTEGCMSLFDAPLQNNFYNASRTPDGGFDMRTILDNSLMKERPTFAVTLVDNHDTQPCQALEHWVDWWFKPLAYSLILLRQEGYPCVFYPDLYGAQYNDKNLNINIEPVDKIEQILMARKKFAYGEQLDYFDDKNTIGWIREGDDKHKDSGMAVILTNGPDASKQMKLGEKYAGLTFIDFLGNVDAQVEIDDKGFGLFKVKGGSVSIWVVKK